MSKIMDQLLTVPTVDPDDTRRRKLLNILLSGTSILAIIAFIVVIIVDQFALIAPSIRFITYAAPIAVFFGALFFYFINIKK